MDYHLTKFLKKNEDKKKSLNVTVKGLFINY